MQLGDWILVSPELTDRKNWQKGQIIDMEENPFNGLILSVQMADGNIFFGKAPLFKSATLSA